MTVGVAGRQNDSWCGRSVESQLNKVTIETKDERYTPIATGRGLPIVRAKPGVGRVGTKTGVGPRQRAGLLCCRNDRG